jgi:hypothetical protein
MDSGRLSLPHWISDAALLDSITVISRIISSLPAKKSNISGK